ncbi:pentapeptide repeat-containing protein [Bordetella bronchiseptica]|uniref:pentapeptide repeat-containing protein n=1 Tax=Bordetella bronchiseptica TaxID=518 RepID=UPI0004A0CA93|nr:pentapeptide repeat-containing protein [Bordetella bronchiseptica]KDB58419.1 pentapeptide repeat protein [Bordetella bronchiseptica A1-7]KDB73067.1 pentapeptide repeat protein [Bordetella bronchiseptica B20-10725633]
MKFEIKNRYTGAVLFTADVPDDTESGLIARVALEQAVERDANLRGADLRGADLGGANLRGADLGDANLGDANLGDANLRGADLGGANLRGADLGGANLRGADLRGANLRGADLRGANLRGADLGGANLRGADLRGADLGGANLRGADLRGANLRGADLRGANLRGADLGGANLRGADLRGADLGDANLTPIRDDMWAVLSATPTEVPALIAALKAGRVDGSTYQGECACLVGTLANAREVSYSSIESLEPNSSRPIERFFLSISRGDTPGTNQFSKLALEWAEEWLARMQAAFSPQTAA